MIDRELNYIRRNLRSAWHAASVDTQIFDDWDHRRITTEVALARFVRNNGLDARMISSEALVAFMNSLGYDNTRPSEDWKRKLLGYY